MALNMMAPRPIFNLVRSVFADEPFSVVLWTDLAGAGICTVTSCRGVLRDDFAPRFFVGTASRRMSCSGGSSIDGCKGLNRADFLTRRGAGLPGLVGVSVEPDCGICVLLGMVLVFENNVLLTQFLCRGA